MGVLDTIVVFITTSTLLNENDPILNNNKKFQSIKY